MLSIQTETKGKGLQKLHQSHSSGEMVGKMSQGKYSSQKIKAITNNLLQSN